MDPQTRRRVATALGLRADATDQDIRDAIARAPVPIPGVLPARFQPATVDREARSIEAVIATENPVRIFDWRTWEEVDEVLLMSGLDIDAIRPNMPLLDAHSRYTCADVLGSWDAIRVEGTQLLGRATFSSVESDTFTKAAEGHLSGISVGYHVHEFRILAPGESAEIDGRLFTCPENASRSLKIVTRWSAVEGSLVPIGADPAAGTRSVAGAAPAPAPHPPPTHPTHRNPTMNPITFALLSRGFTKEQAERHTATLATLEQDAALAVIRTMHPGDSDSSIRQAVAAAGGDDRNLSDEQRQEAIRTGVAAERARCDAIRAAFAPYLERTGNVTDASGNASTRTGADLLNDAIANPDTTADQARQSLLAFLAAGEGQASLGRHITTGTEDRDHFRANAQAAIEVRAAGIVAPDNDTRARAGQYGTRSLIEIARESLVNAGLGRNEALRMNPMELAACAYTSRLPDGRALPGQTTSDFPNILANVANKMLIAGYDNAPGSFRSWCYIDSVPDFKAKSILGLSNLTVLQVVPEGQDYPLHTLSEQKETVQALTRGAIVRFTRQAVINDDLDAFSRVPFLAGRAANVTVNRLAVVKLLANPTMAYDSVALFATGHANLLEGTAYDPTTTEKAKAALNAMKTKLRKQTGIEAGEPLDLMPQIVLGGPTAEDFLREAVADTSTTDASRVPNRGIRNLQVEIDPQLENTNITGNSATAIHMFANPIVAPVIVVAFLNGVQTPYLERQTDFSSDGIDHKVRHDVGVGVADHRGGVRSTGIAAA